MSKARVSRDDSPPEMIEAMTRCAYELGLAAGEIAKRAGDDTTRFLAAAAEFRHCFFAVRMGIRLKLAERAAARAVQAAAPAGRPERERPEREAPETEREDWPEKLETEREREGDYEPVSLPQFLKSLGVVAAGAERRRDELPSHVRDTTLPMLQGFLGQAKAPPDGASAAASAVLARPAALPATRSRLLGSTVTPGLPPRRPATPARRLSG